MGVYLLCSLITKGQSMNVQNKYSIMIFSAFESENSNEKNIDNTAIVESYLVEEKVPFKKIMGCYKGSNELAFIVPLSYYKQLLPTINKYNQESVLIINADRKATLFYLKSGKNEQLGDFVNVSMEEAIDRESYAYDFANRNYYVTK